MSLKIHQDALLYQLLLQQDEGCQLDVTKERCVYVHVVAGKLSVNGEALKEGDGATINETTTINFTGLTDCEALIFDLP